MQATESADLLNRFLSQSSAIDVGDVSITFMKYLVGRNVLQAIPVGKVKDWDKIIPLFTKGVYPNGSEASTQGVAPYSVLYATGPDGQKFANGPTEWLTGIPTITNADTLGHPPRSGRPAGDQLGRSDQPRIQGQGGAAGPADGRRHRRRDGAGSARRRQIRQQGQHDQGRDRQDDRHDDRHQEIRSLPLVLDDLRPVGEFDGLGRGGDPVDVVAGRHRREVARHPGGVPAVARGLPRLGLYAGADEAPDRPQARCVLRVHELVHLRVPGRVHRPPGLLLVDPGKRQEVPLPRPSGTTGTAASRPRPTSPIRTAS